jgi:hypothetical protein
LSLITKSICLSLLINLFSPLNAWDGYDYTNGSYIDIESYDHQGKGEGDVEFYDYKDGKYKTGYMDMHRDGSAEIETDDGEYIEVEMD